MHEWNRGNAERLIVEVQILSRALNMVHARERQEKRTGNPRHVRPEQCKARPETVALREAITAKIEEADAALLAMVSDYVETWPAEKVKS